MAGRFSVESVFKAVDRVTAPVRKMQSRVNKFTRSMRRGFRAANRAVGKFGSGLKRATVIGTVALLSLGLVMGNIIRTGAEFEQTLVSAAVKFPGKIRKGTEAFKELEDIARKTGATTEFTATQAAEGLNFLAFAGFNVEQAIAALPGVVDLATVAAIDLGRASDIATDSVGAFGLATKDSAQLAKNLARVNDVLALTSIRTNTDMETLFEGIVKGAPAFTAAGQSMESFAALMGVMANSGIKGAEAGTILRNTVLRLSNPVSKAAKVMKSLGVNVADNEGNFRDILDIMEDFEKGLVGVGEVQRAAALGTVFGTRAVSGLNVQLKEGTTSIAEFRKELKGAAGTTSEMASVIRDTLQGRINALTSVIEGLKITLFSLKNVALAGVIERMTSFVRTVDTAINANDILATELIDGLLRAAKGVLGVFGLLIGTFIALKIIMVTVSVLTTAWTVGLFLLNTAIFAFNIAIGIAKIAMAGFNIIMAANPIGAVILAVTVLIGLGILLIRNWDNIVATITSAVAKIKTVLGFLIAPFRNIIAGFSSVLGAARLLGLIGGGEEGARRAGEGEAPSIVTPQARIAQTIEERRETSTVDINIKDENSRADIVERGRVPGVKLKLAESGAF